MSVLSPVATAIIGNLQAGIKADSGDDNAFLSLLEGNASGFLAGSQAEQSLVDSLYERDDDPEPVAVAQPPANIYIEHPPVPEVATRAPQPETVRQEVPLSERAPQVDKPQKPDAPDDRSVPEQSAPRPVNDNGAKPPAKADAPSETTDTESLSQKLRAKINELSDLLSSIASILGLGNISQVSVVQVTQTTIVAQSSLSTSQVGLDVNQPFLDLSDRFDQLIAAISASQNLPGATGQSLTATFSSFQSLAFSFTDSAGAFDSEAFLAKCATCQTNLNSTLQGLSVTQTTTSLATGGVDFAKLSAELQKLSSLLGDVQQTVVKAPEIDGTNANIVQASLVQPQSSASTIAAPKKQAANDVSVNAITQASVNIVPGASLPVQQANPVNTQTANVAVATVENTVGLEANLSQGNSNSGQGGERSPASAINTLSGAGTASAAGNTQAPTFSKALKAAAQVPVAEQVAFNIKTAVKDGASKIQINLDPAELGKLHIRIELSGDGKASGIVITAENKSTLELLQRDARGLENALADAGIKAESGSLSFNLQGGQQGQEEKRQALAGYTSVLPEEDELAPLAVVSRSYVVNLSDGLDIKI